MSASTVSKHGRRPLFLELDEADRAALDRVVTRAQRTTSGKVRIIDVVRRLIREADAAVATVGGGRS